MLELYPAISGQFELQLSTRHN